MVFGTGCEPDLDWSRCEADTGYPQVLPYFYIVCAVLNGVLGTLYVTSIVKTVRTQLKEKKKLSYNTAMQMHVGIVAFSVAATIHSMALVSQEPSVLPLVLLLLLHARLLLVGYVTMVLVRHWAVLYQQMGQSQGTQGQLNESITRFVELYRDGEVIQAVLTCLFFVGTIIYGINNQDQWEKVERIEFLVWAIIGGITCWLVTFLGRRVYGNMKSVARSRAVLEYLRRVKYVVIGSSILWFQCTVCFAMDAAMDRPLTAWAWLTVRAGATLTEVGTGFLYYTVIGAKVAERAANAAALEVNPLPVVGVKQKFYALARLVSSGANQIMEGVGTIVGETSTRVFIDYDSEEARRPSRKASSPILARASSVISPRRSVSKRSGEEGGSRGRAGSGAGRRGDSCTAPEGFPSETKRQMPDTLDEEAEINNDLLFGGRRDNKGGEVNDGSSGDGENSTQGMLRETGISPMLSKSSSLSSTAGGIQEEGRRNATEDDETSSGEVDSGRHKQQRQSGQQNQSSSSCQHDISRDNPSSDNAAQSSGEAWEVEELETPSLNNSSHDGSLCSSRHQSRSTEED